MKIATQILVATILLANTQLASCDEVTIANGETERTLVGEFLAVSQDDSKVLFQTADGKLWPLTNKTIKSKTDNDENIEPLSRRELGKKIQQELGEDFKIHEANSFVIVYNTHEDFARWVAGLYNKLERSFDRFWTRNKFKLADRPDFKLPVIVFRTRLEYEQYMSRDIGGVNSEMMAYYNYASNRVVMYDLIAGQNGQPVQIQRINALLNNPRAIPMVATIIHEGTHQLMFNYGMQTRYSDTPLWINEGMAMYFETPDLSTSRGLGKIGQINHLRLRQFLKYLHHRPTNALELMIKSDDGFRAETALEYYAQSWAFNYFLLTKHTKSFVNYLKHMSQKPRLIYDTPEQRLQEFQEHLDLELNELDRQFIQFIRKLNRE